MVSGEGTMAVVVVLAAGSSSRMGQPKALVRFGGHTLVEQAVHAVSDADMEAVVVVSPELADAVGELLPSALVVVNQRPEEGMASSIVTGLGSVAPERHVIVLAVDQPLVSGNDLRRLADAAVGHDAAAADHGGRPGIPACFAPSMHARLLELSGDLGARELLRNGPYDVVVVPGIDARDADTVAALELLEREASRSVEATGQKETP